MTQLTKVILSLKIYYIKDPMEILGLGLGLGLNFSKTIREFLSSHITLKLPLNVDHHVSHKENSL